MFLSLISGSSGNAALITDSQTRLLVDCGMSGRKLEQCLASIDLSPKDIDAILLTHEHIDHTAGAGVVCRRYGLPLYATAGTFAGMSAGPIPEERIHIIKNDTAFEIGRIGIIPFSISHDANEPVGFRFAVNGKIYAVATDTGIMTDSIRGHLYGADAVLLESNHDLDMLMYGSYPFSLKERIRSARGHLSNDDSARTAVELLRHGTSHIMLGHLSKENNTPEIAYKTAENALVHTGAVLSRDVCLCVAKRSEVTRLI